MTPDLFDMPETTALRARWRDLVERRLPRAAAPGWPISADHCFARVLLDCSCGRPWREVIAPPAWRNAPPDILLRAIQIGEAILDGHADLPALNRRSLMLRGKL